MKQPTVNMVRGFARMRMCYETQVAARMRLLGAPRSAARTQALSAAVRGSLNQLIGVCADGMIGQLAPWSAPFEQLQAWRIVEAVVDKHVPLPWWALQRSRGIQ